VQVATQACPELYPTFFSQASFEVAILLVQMAGAFPLGPGYRFATVTPEDSSGIVYVVAFLGFTYSSLTFIARCFIKWRVVGLDDLAMLLAQVCSLRLHYTCFAKLRRADCQSRPVRTHSHVSFSWAGKEV
jgi:hypothetical protein